MTDNDYTQDAYFEGECVDKVRMLDQTKKYSVDVMNAAIKWLAAKDAVAREAKLALENEQVRIAASSKDAAWVSALASERSAAAAERANKRATAGIVLAILSLVIAVAGMIFHH